MLRTDNCGRAWTYALENARLMMPRSVHMFGGSLGQQDCGSLVRY